MTFFFLPKNLLSASHYSTAEAACNHADDEPNLEVGDDPERPSSQKTENEKDDLKPKQSNYKRLILILRIKKMLKKLMLIIFLVNRIGGKSTE